MRIDYKNLLTTLACVLFVLQSNAQQQGRLVFNNYSTEHGLTSPEVYCVLQDSKGYMWFGTDQGVSRFDGYQFYNFGRSEGLTSHVIFSMIEDKNQDIWISTMTGEVFIYRDDKLIDYPFNDCILQYNKEFYSVKLLHIDNEGTAYFDLKYVGVLRIDRHGNDQLFTTTHPLTYLIIPLKDAVLATTVYKSNEVRLSPRPVPTDPHYMMPIEYYFADSTRQVISKMEYKYVVHATFLIDTLRQIHLISRQNEYLIIENNNIIASNRENKQINGIYISGTGEIYCAMHNKAGLRKYSDLNALIHNKYTILLPDLFCSMVTFDKDGGLWVTTLEDGIYYCKNPGLQVFDQYSGLSDDYILSLAISGENSFFLGLRNGNIAYFDPSKSICREYKHASLFRQLPFDLRYDTRQKILLTGTSWMDSQLNSYPYKGQLSEKNVDAHVFKFGNSTDQNWMYAINYNALHKIDLNTYIHEILFKENDRNKMYAVHQSKAGKIWIGRQSGLFSYENGELDHCGLDNPVFHNRIEDLEELQDSTLVLGTNGHGLVLVKGSEYYFISKENGMTSDFVNDLHIDQSGDLWVATNTGLNKLRFSEKKYTIEQYTTSTGLPANEIYKIDSNKDKIWVATRKGLVCISGVNYTQNNLIPVITDFVVNGQAANLNQNEINYTDNDIKIEFITINYKQEGRIPYRYRLSHEMPWTITHKPAAEYMALDHGKYKFEVQSQNEHGNWSESSSILFRILPPWWLDYRAWLLIGVIIILSIVIYVRLRIRHIKNEMKIKTEMADLERKAIQAQMNPHFIFNALNSIQSFIIKEDKENATFYLSLFSSLIRKTLEFSGKKDISIEMIRNFLDQYLSLEKLRFENKFDFSITIDPEIDSYETSIPPMLIQPLVENAVVHAFNGVTENGKISIEFKIDKHDFLKVIIKDNGKGITYPIKQSDHLSFGIESIRRRLELLDAGSGLYSLQIESNQNTKGTVAEIKTGIKITKSHVTKTLQSSHH
ncbi:MAG: histidine kinase [Saprospiraceae bacterium]|nr:histidine kinase [Saprospiraceae bacterium]